MKKAISAIIAAFVLGIALPSLAADNGPELHMNVRFMDNTYSGNGGSQASTTAENRASLHVIELSAAQEVDNFGGYVLYRLGDQDQVTGAKTANYPVEAKVYYKTGDFKITEGLQFVPFGIYKFNNLYNPFLDTVGQAGFIWDSDWGTLVNFNSKPVNIDLGYWMGAGSTYSNNSQLAANTRIINGVALPGDELTPQARMETAEKSIYTGRIGWDILKNLNAGASYMDGKVDNNFDGKALTTKKVWALDTTWGIVENLQLEAEYAGYKFGPQEVAAYKGDLGLVQLKYDIVKVPSPLNKISPVLEYSWNNDKLADGSKLKVKNYQEELWIKAAKNLDVFLQFMQEKYNFTGADTDKRGILAVKYSFQ